MLKIPFVNRYQSLGEQFYRATDPTPVIKPGLIRFNHGLAKELGLVVESLSDDELAAIFSGNVIPEGAQPLAMAYTGHQFGHFNPQLGDGRAILLGEVDTTEGRSMSIQLKGSGPTPYSRNGDGRAALGPVLREYLVSEAMHKMGVPTTRALCAVTTGEDAARDQLIPGGVITRVASSFVRVGTFEFFASRGDIDSIRQLADFVIRHNYPEIMLETGDSENVYIGLLQAAVNRQASLIAKWLGLGFIHGVMNTDNMSVAGETIDYGPCAFMDAYQHDQVFSSIDRYGRYAYNQQPAIALWNLTRFAECLVPLFGDDVDAGVETAQDILKGFRDRHEADWLSVMSAKLGIYEPVQQDLGLIEELRQLMEDNQADFTLTFRYLSELDAKAGENDNDFCRLFYQSVKIDEWLQRWRDRVSQQKLSDEARKTQMRQINPLYIPRNHQIEKAIRAAEDHDDFAVFHAMHEVLQNPYLDQKGKEAYELPPKPDEMVLKTFCGT